MGRTQRGVSGLGVDRVRSQRRCNWLSSSGSIRCDGVGPAPRAIAPPSSHAGLPRVGATVRAVAPPSLPIALMIGIRSCSAPTGPAEFFCDTVWRRTASLGSKRGVGCRLIKGQPPRPTTGTYIRIATLRTGILQYAEARLAVLNTSTVRTRRTVADATDVRAATRKPVSIALDTPCAGYCG